MSKNIHAMHFIKSKFQVDGVPLRRQSIILNIMQQTIASQFPRVAIVKVKGLKSHKAVHLMLVKSLMPRKTRIW